MGKSTQTKLYRLIKTLEKYWIHSSNVLNSNLQLLTLFKLNFHPHKISEKKIESISNENDWIVYRPVDYNDLQNVKVKSFDLIFV